MAGRLTAISAASDAGPPRSQTSIPSLRIAVRESPDSPKAAAAGCRFLAPRGGRRPAGAATGHRPVLSCPRESSPGWSIGGCSSTMHGARFFRFDGRTCVRAALGTGGDHRRRGDGNDGGHHLPGHPAGGPDARAVGEEYAGGLPATQDLLASPISVSCESEVMTELHVSELVEPFEHDYGPWLSGVAGSHVRRPRFQQARMLRRLLPARPRDHWRGGQTEKGSCLGRHRCRGSSSCPGSPAQADPPPGPPCPARPAPPPSPPSPSRSAGTVRSEPRLTSRSCRNRPAASTRRSPKCETSRSIARRARLPSNDGNHMNHNTRLRQIPFNAPQGEMGAYGSSADRGAGCQ